MIDGLTWYRVRFVVQGQFISEDIVYLLLLFHLQRASNLVWFDIKSSYGCPVTYFLFVNFTAYETQSLAFISFECQLDFNPCCNIKQFSSSQYYILNCATYLCWINCSGSSEGQFLSQIGFLWPALMVASSAFQAGASLLKVNSFSCPNN